MICEECGVEYGDDVWFCPKCAVMLSRSDAKIPTVDTDAASEDKPDIQTNVNKDTQNDAHISHTAQDFEQPGFRPQPSGRVEAEYKIIESETVENEQFNTFEDRIARKTNQIAYKLDLLLIQALAKIRGNQMEIPDFLKLYFARKLRIMLTMVLICIIGIIVTAALQSNAGKPAVFTLHSELEALYRKGRRYVVIDSSIENMVNNIDLNPRVQASTVSVFLFSNMDNYRRKVLALPDRSVMLYEETILPVYTPDSMKAYSIKNDKTLHNEYVEQINARIIALQDSIIFNSRYNYSTPTDPVSKKMSEEKAILIQKMEKQVMQLQELLVNLSPFTLAYANVEGVRIAASVFYFIFYAAMLVFISLSIVYGVIFIRPEKSYTYNFIAQYGDAAFLLSECEKSLNGQITEINPLKPKGRITNSEFVILAYPLHVYIAPANELLWAYIAFNVETGGRGAARTYYSIIYCFSSGERKAVRIEFKNEGIRELAMIKNLNPHVLIGFNNDLQSMYVNDFGVFKQQIQLNVGQLQEGVTAGEQANIRASFWGMDFEYV